MSPYLDEFPSHIMFPVCLSLLTASADPPNRLSHTLQRSCTSQTEITSLRFYFPSCNTASHSATCRAAGSRDTGGLGLRGDAGFQKPKAQIPAQRGWLWQAGEQRCCKGCDSTHSGSGNEGGKHVGQTQHTPPRATEPSSARGSLGTQQTSCLVPRCSEGVRVSQCHHPPHHSHPQEWGAPCTLLLPAQLTWQREARSTSYQPNFLPAAETTAQEGHFREP